MGSYKLVMFDMIGTTVLDSASGNSVIIDSFRKAFAEYNISLSYAELNSMRGKSKNIAIQEILSSKKLGGQYSSGIYDAFMLTLESLLWRFTEMPSASNLFNQLVENNIMIGLGSGLPMRFIDKLIGHLNWNKANFDFISSSEDLPFGRPHPVMINKAMDLLDIKEHIKVMKVGDTIMDVLEGKNAKVTTVMVTSGTQSRDDLGKVKPDHIIDSISDLPKLIFNNPN